METKIYRVKDVELHIVKGGPPRVIVVAYGLVPTTGWSNGRLSKYIYIVPPAKGIWDFDFVAEPPIGPAGDVVSPIVASYVWTERLDRFKGVRVHSATNSVEKLLSSAREFRIEKRAALARAR